MESQSRDVVGWYQRQLSWSYQEIDKRTSESGMSEVGFCVIGALPRLRWRQGMSIGIGMQISPRRPPGIGKGGVQLDKGTGSGGGVAVITKPDTRQKTKRKSKTEHEPSWRVLLHNDDVHTFDYVTGAIVKVCPRMRERGW